MLEKGESCYIIHNCNTVEAPKVHASVHDPPFKENDCNGNTSFMSGDCNTPCIYDDRNSKDIVDHHGLDEEVSKDHEVFKELKKTDEPSPMQSFLPFPLSFGPFNCPDNGDKVQLEEVVPESHLHEDKDFYSNASGFNPNEHEPMLRSFGNG